MWRSEDVKMWCEDEQMWRREDVKMSRCEKEKVWEKVWRWEGVKMRRCEDEIQTPTIGRTLRSDALGNQNMWFHRFQNLTQKMFDLTMSSSTIHTDWCQQFPLGWTKNQLHWSSYFCIATNIRLKWCHQYISKKIAIQLYSTILTSIYHLTSINHLTSC
jgi:hypothetical protein